MVVANVSRNLFLFAFDFDHTIVDGNSDLMIQAAYNVEPIPEYFKVEAREGKSITYMQEIFRFHYPSIIRKRDHHAVLDNIPFVPGIPECIINLKKLGGELIVISDANSYFIEHTLKHHKLWRHFNDVFSNPGYIDKKGQLVISPYMNNLECKMSSRNLCKGKVLIDYVKRRNREGQSFAFVGFAGDGINDFCPMYRLGANDLACGRQGFSIGDFIAKKASERVFLKSELMFWKSGLDIVDAVREKLSEMGYQS